MNIYLYLNMLLINPRFYLFQYLFICRAEKLSRIDVLRRAIRYILWLQMLLEIVDKNNTQIESCDGNGVSTSFIRTTNNNLRNPQQKDKSWLNFNSSNNKFRVNPSIYQCKEHLIFLSYKLLNILFRIKQKPCNFIFNEI